MTPRPIRVLYLNHSAKPSGGEIALWRMLSERDAGRIQPTIVFGEEGPAVEMMRQIGVETHVLPLATNVREMRKDKLGLNTLLHFGRLATLGVYAARLALFARRHRIGVIHTNTIKAHFYGAFVGRLSGLPVVWHLRDYVNESYFPSRVVRAIRFLAQRLPRHVITVSRSVMDQLGFADAARRSSVVLDGLTDQELAPSARRQPAPDTKLRPRIGIVGRLAKWKGQHLFLEAASRVIAAGHDARFVVIGSALFGEDAYERGLRKQANDLGISDRVEFRGFVQNVAGELSKLDLLVHASTSDEPFGQVILEGMAFGLPVVATRGGGVPEIVADGENGLLTRMGDAVDLAAALLRLLDDPDYASRLGSNGYQHVRQHFRASRGAQQVSDLYKAILS